MEKKIRAFALFGVFIICIGSCDSNKANNNIHVKNSSVFFDSLLFGNVSQFESLKNTFALKNNIFPGENGFVLKTTGQGVTIWIDTVLYINIGKDAVSLIAKTFGDIKFIYYNCDSLYSETTSLHTPTITEYKLNRTKALRLYDSTVQFGRVAQLFRYYKFYESGVLAGNCSLDPSKKIADTNFDFSVREQIEGDSLLIYQKFSKNDSIALIKL